MASYAIRKINANSRRYWDGSAWQPELHHAAKYTSLSSAINMLILHIREEYAGESSDAIIDLIALTLKKKVKP